MNAEERACRERLQAWADKLNQLYRMYDSSRSHPVMPADRIDAARQLYSDIKNGLKEEYRRMDTARGEAELTEAERRSYKHVVHEAYVRLDAATNANPEEWRTGIYEALGDFERAIMSFQATES